MDKDSAWEVLVVGGGPAGMMAAGTAASKGAKVLLLEKNNELGKKLLITGGGRCNVTNAELDNRLLLAKFKAAGEYLFSAFTQWSVAETLNFFNSRGVATKVEGELRVFPISNSAKTIWDTLLAYLKENQVTIRSNSPVVGLVKEGEALVGVELKDKQIIKARSIIIATGGTSRPETGSTGDAYAWLTELGHTVIQPEPSLVPIALKDIWVKRVAGVTLNPVKITVLQNSVKQLVSKKGKLLFTHVGVSGPTILNLSKDIGELLKYGEVMLSLDLCPTDGYDTLNTKLQTLFKAHDKKMIQNSLSELIPQALVPIVLELAELNLETRCNSITREERLRLVNLLKNVPAQVSHLLGVEKAIITSGGVALNEVDFKTMRSRLYPNLYLIGDILNIDRPSGGYSLQLCWTTGVVAGTWAAIN